MAKDFFASKKNDSFTELKGLDLQELLVQVANYSLAYKDKLGLPDDLLFDVKIDYDYMLKHPKTNKFIKHIIQGWIDYYGSNFKTNLTLYPMQDKPKIWANLKNECESLIKRKITINDIPSNPYDYVKINTSILGTDVEAWRKFLKMYAVYEHIITRFICGDKIGIIKRFYQIEKTIAEPIFTLLDDINESTTINDLKYFLPTLSYATFSLQNIDFSKLHKKDSQNAITFASPNAGTNYTIWQNNINAFAKLMLSTKRALIDEEYLDYKLQEQFCGHITRAYLYNSINIQDVMEFVDIIFTNNLDKVCFLKQYFRDFQDEYNVKPLTRVKKI